MDNDQMTNQPNNFCPGCGKEVEENQNFCPVCGKELQNVQSENKYEKPLYKKVWFWLIILAVVIAVSSVIGIIVDKNKDEYDYNYDYEEYVGDEQLSVEEAVNSILEMKCYEINDMVALYDENKDKMNDEQKNQCLNQYRKWAVFNIGVNDLKEKMKNPKSFEFDDGTISLFFENDDGSFYESIKVTYYASNSFGGTLQGNAEMIIDYEASSTEMEILQIKNITYLSID